MYQFLNLVQIAKDRLNKKNNWDAAVRLQNTELFQKLPVYWYTSLLDLSCVDAFFGRTTILCTQIIE